MVARNLAYSRGLNYPTTRSPTGVVVLPFRNRRHDPRAIDLEALTFTAMLRRADLAANDREYGRSGALDQIAAEDRRIANERVLLERDHRQSYYYDVLTHLARLEDAMLCSPRFPLAEYREWRVTWRHTTAGVRLFGSAKSRDAFPQPPSL